MDNWLAQYAVCSVAQKEKYKSAGMYLCKAKKQSCLLSVELSQIQTQFENLIGKKSTLDYTKALVKNKTRRVLRVDVLWSFTLDLLF